MFFLILHIFISSIVGGCFTADNGDKLIIAYADDDLQDKYGKIIYSSVEGKKREYNLGKWFRQRYKKNLIAGGYKSGIVTTNSTGPDRTLMSAELLLAGLFPPSETEMWNDENLRWQPIPVHSVPFGIDNVLLIQIPCERYDLEEFLVNNSPEMETFYRTNEDIFRYAQKYSGLEMPSDKIITAIKQLWTLFDDLSIEESNNVTLPNWTKKIYPEPIYSLGKLQYTVATQTQEMKKLTAGTIWNRMVQDMQKKRSEQYNQTLQLYSGHDSTISSFLHGLNMYNNIPPPYGAAVIVELRQKQDIFIVTVLYRNSTTDPPYLLEIPGCGDICTLDELVILTQDLVLEDRPKECQVNVFEKLYYLIQLHPTVSIISICSFLVVFIIFAMLWLRDKKRYTQYK